MTRSQLNIRIPPDEKRELKHEASRHGISMSALVRINNLQARANREREAVRRRAYPERAASDK
jgi:predicted HicB family RNase H-like nuclease